MNEPPAAHRQDFDTYLHAFRERIQHLFHVRGDIDTLSINRGAPPYIFNGIQSLTPLACSIPTEHGGRGAKPREILSVLEAASYESLALSLILGINGALFLEPLAKYGTESMKENVFGRFINDRAMGGLMMTEPDFGTDALAIRTAYVDDGERCRIQGEKHWAGLSGWADFWLVTARKKRNDGSFDRDIAFFLCDANEPDQVIHAEEFYPNLGLFLTSKNLSRLQ